MGKIYKKNYLTKIIFLGLSACFAYLFYFTRFKWGDLVVDTFRDPLVVLKIINGKVLYKDISYEYGLFAPYFLSLICKVFGFHLNTFVGCGIVITAFMSWLLYKISRFFLDEIISGLAVFTFLLVFAFGFYCYNSIFNFILPYSFASIFFTLFVSLTIYLFLRFIFDEKPYHLIFANLSLLFAILCRVEMGLLIWSGFAIACALLSFKNKNVNWLRLWGFLVITLILGASVYFVFLLKMKAFAGFKESIIDAISVTAANPFVVSGSGLDNALVNILLVFKSLFFQLGILFLLGVGSYGVSSFMLKEEKPRSRLFLGMILIISVFGVAKGLMQEGLQYRCLPLILLIGITTFFIRTLRPFDYKKTLALFTLFLIALIMILKVFLKSGPYNYGFYLLGPGLICYYIFFFEALHGHLEKQLKYFSEPLFFSIVAAFFIMLCFNWWDISSQLYRARNATLYTQRGKFITWNNDITSKCWEAIDYLNKNTNKADTVIVLPEAGGINFFSERENPLRYYSVMPQSMMINGEKKIISLVLESRADYIVIAQRDTLEYGAASFGVDYALNLISWIKENYEVIKLFGPYPYTSSEFGIAIFKRRL